MAVPSLLKRISICKLCIGIDQVLIEIVYFNGIIIL